jgi:arylsulfatase A-like enzyme
MFDPKGILKNTMITRILGFCCLALATFSPRPSPAIAPARPNMIVILVDDMGFSDIGCYGSEIPTPNLDKLAGDGVRFTQFYNTPRCSPTRAALLTGLYSHQAGMGWLDNKVEPKSQGFHGRLLPRCVTIAEVLREAGYFTAMTGKWHLGQQNGGRKPRACIGRQIAWPPATHLLGTRREQGHPRRQVEARPEVARPLGTL